MGKLGHYQLKQHWFLIAVTVDIFFYLFPFGGDVKLK